jgi:hypothetical protein
MNLHILDWISAHIHKATDSRKRFDVYISDGILIFRKNESLQPSFRIFPEFLQKSRIAQSRKDLMSDFPLKTEPQSAEIGNFSPLF